MKPHDPVDRALAPVALALDERLEELGSLSRDSLDFHIVVESGGDTPTREMRARGLLASAVYLIDLRGWNASWSEPGLQMSHGEHRLALGLPQSLHGYLAE